MKYLCHMVPGSLYYFQLLNYIKRDAENAFNHFPVIAFHVSNQCICHKDVLVLANRPDNHNASAKIFSIL